MQYMLMIHGDESAMPSVPTDRIYEMNAAYVAYTEALKSSGAWVSGDRLKPSTTATVVRATNGKTDVLDGPFADIKEQLGGYYVIEAPDLDAAIAWAAKCPGAAFGAIEVRPVWQAAMAAR